MEEIAGMVGGVSFIVAVGWIIRVISNNRRQVRLAQQQGEMQSKLLDKFGSSQELMEYLQSDAGLRFLESATIERGNPYRRILGSVQAGIVLLCGGFACLFLNEHIPGAEQGFLFLGAIGVALGTGFVLSAAVAFFLSKSWGLVNGNRHDLPSEL